MSPLAPNQPKQLLLRATAALPAAGAWDPTPLELDIAGADRISIYFTYERGAVDGAFDFQLHYSPWSVAPAAAVNEWYYMSLYASGALAAGVQVASRIQTEHVIYQAMTANAESFIYGPLELLDTAQRIRLIARESGVVGTPGDLQVYAVIAASPEATQ